MSHLTGGVGWLEMPLAHSATSFFHQVVEDIMFQTFCQAGRGESSQAFCHDLTCEPLRAKISAYDEDPVRKVGVQT